MLKKLIIVVCIIAIIVIIVSAFNAPKKYITQPTQIINKGSGVVLPQTKPIENNPVACTMEAKLCSDGSYVSRTGPNCEFVLCPENKIQISTRTSINKTINNNGVLITPLEVTEDSRCPQDTNCMWSGTVKLRVKLESGTTNQEITMTLGAKAIYFMDKNITLVSVSPNATKDPILQKDYLFTFKVK